MHAGVFLHVQLSLNICILHKSVPPISVTPSDGLWHQTGVSQTVAGSLLISLPVVHISPFLALNSFPAFLWAFAFDLKYLKWKIIHFFKTKIHTHFNVCVFSAMLYPLLKQWKCTCFSAGCQTPSFVVVVNIWFVGGDSFFFLNIS